MSLGVNEIQQRKENAVMIKKMLVIVGLLAVVGICVAAERRICACTYLMGSCGENTGATLENGCVQTDYMPSGKQDTLCDTQEDWGGDSCDQNWGSVSYSTMTWTITIHGCEPPIRDIKCGSAPCNEAEVQGSCD